MKSTGIVRRIDELGRFVLPVELRRTMGIGEREELEIFVDGSAIVLKRHTPACIFCGGGERIFIFRNKNICESCMKELVRFSGE